jgi:nitroimidazol reductase NimA-like FMN-containing flavoprotein (pyridoxamine 5'-phosphate oxidase superfamily)
MTDVSPTPRTTLKRLPARGSYDRQAIHGVLDEAPFCHVGFVDSGQVFVIPTIHARVGEELYLHGAPASRMLGTLAGGAPVCVTATLLDGLVLARSAFHHSMNYRSVVVLAVARLVTDLEEKRHVLEALVERVLPGRSREARPPSTAEMNRTHVVALPITEASAKSRVGGPLDDESDYELACWAGELPLRLCPGTPVPDARLAVGTPLSPAVTRGIVAGGRYGSP